MLKYKHVHRYNNFLISMDKNNKLKTNYTPNTNENLTNIINRINENFDKSIYLNEYQLFNIVCIILI